MFNEHYVDENNIDDNVFYFRHYYVLCNGIDNCVIVYFHLHELSFQVSTSKAYLASSIVTFLSNLLVSLTYSSLINFCNHQRYADFVITSLLNIF